MLVAPPSAFYTSSSLLTEASWCGASSTLQSSYSTTRILWGGILSEVFAAGILCAPIMCCYYAVY